MKKVTAILAVAALMTTAAHAQLNLGSLLNTVSNVAGTVYSAPVSLDGTYTYNGVAVSVSSSDGNLLSNLAGSAVTSGIETKIDAQLAKVGIKPGSFTISFNKDDNTFTMNILGIPLNGTYKVGDAEKTVTLQFGKTINYLSMNGNLESGLTEARMVFQANKVLTLLKKVASLAGQSSSTIGAVTSLADGYDNFKLGFKLKK